MNQVTASLEMIRTRIAEAERRFDRVPGSVSLLAVSKTQPPEAVEAAAHAGQRAFGENHLQDALIKLDALGGMDLEWHFIGPVQSNKTRAIAQRFDWVHSVDRIRVAERLNAQRAPGSHPLNVCLQVNISGETSKSGVLPDEVGALADAIAELPNLRLRGVMAIPAPSVGFDAQREALHPLSEIYQRLRADGHSLDTLSMGMTDDLEAAIAEGSTTVRIGTAIFGARRGKARGLHT